LIRCKICGRWISRIENTFKELEHIDEHVQKNPEEVISQTHLTKNFEVVAL
jgi:DNA-directed RNA polymerase subunit N (RpoN/RPB10)